MATCNVLNVEIINPLHLIEAVMGNVETWPSNIIKLIFIDDLNSENIFEIGAFFYGNKVPLDVAYPFYAMCKKHNPFRALVYFKSMCNMWKTHSCCVGTYYDETKKKDVTSSWTTSRNRRGDTLGDR